MKQPYPRFRLAALLGALGLSLSAGAAEFWVSPSGSDASNGTHEQPFGSPAFALRKARELRRTATAPLTEPVKIILRGGEYALSESLLVRPEDSGTPESPTLLAAAHGEQPVLSGGIKITGWRKLGESDSPGQLPAEARAQVWVAESPVFNGRPLEFRQLWIRGKKAVRARTPNDGQMLELRGWDRAKREARIDDAVPVPPAPSGVELVMLQMWEIAVLRLKSHRADGERAVVTFHEPESRIEFEHPWPQPATDPKFRNATYFLANSIAFLDTPGEWFEDLSSHRVYYWPRDGEDLATHAVVAAALETVIEIAGTPDRPVHDIRFEGIRVTHTGWLRPSTAGHVPLQAGFFIRDAYGLRPKGTPDWAKLVNQAWLGRPPAAVVAHDAQAISFHRCVFAHTGASGLDLKSGVRDSVIEGCGFADIGINGLVAGDFAEDGFESHLPFNPSDARVLCERLQITNNVFDDCANEDWGGVALMAGFVRDTRIEHNEIANTSYTGISLGWGWTRTQNAAGNNLVRANNIHHIGTRLSDTAGIYTLSAQPGTVVTENSVDAITMSPWVHDPEHWFYLYTDEGSSQITVRNNWCPEPRFLQNANGPGNVWENNGPAVDPAIKAAAGLEPAFRDVRVEDFEAAAVTQENGDATSARAAWTFQARPASRRSGK